jgi:hypothetical protein
MTAHGDPRGPERAAEALDAGITALLHRTLDHAEALAREVREALGEDVYGSPCRRHGWRDCEDITCRQIAEAAAAAVSAERARLYLAIRHTCACQSCKNAIADLTREKTI